MLHAPKGKTGAPNKRLSGSSYLRVTCRSDSDFDVFPATPHASIAELYKDSLAIIPSAAASSMIVSAPTLEIDRQIRRSMQTAQEREGGSSQVRKVT